MVALFARKGAVRRTYATYARPYKGMRMHLACIGYKGQASGCSCWAPTSRQGRQSSIACSFGQDDKWRCSISNLRSSVNCCARAGRPAISEDKIMSPFRCREVKCRKLHRPVRSIEPYQSLVRVTCRKQICCGAANMNEMPSAHNAHI